MELNKNELLSIVNLINPHVLAARSSLEVAEKLMQKVQIIADIMPDDNVTPTTDENIRNG